MAEQTEKAFLKQPKVFSARRNPGRGRGLEKEGTGFGRVLDWDSRLPEMQLKGLTLIRNAHSLALFSVRGRILAGTCHSAKMTRTIIVPAYEKRHSNIPAHISPCFRVKEGDHVIIGQCRLVADSPIL
ncbi:Ribosomal protein S17/S11 [Sesbania bispinosa]|nr:Ribosomal protein S17/S11 [Sesbania bispinosa]